jgi:hypothetical protein
MIQRLDEIIPLVARIDAAGGTANVSFELTGQYAEFDVQISAFANNKAIVGGDADRDPILISASDSRAVSYIRQPTPFETLNNFFAAENARPFILGQATMIFKVQHDNSVVDQALANFTFPLTVYINLLVNYLTKEEYNARVLTERKLQ